MLQSITEIDGLDIHFIHGRLEARERVADDRHVWPGSVIEQLKIIEPLTNPTAHGGSAADAFHLVIPLRRLLRQADSARVEPGQHRQGVGHADARLGYTRYVAQGGDWCNISEVMALQQPPGLLGIHTNMAATVPPRVEGTRGWWPPSGRPLA